MYHGIRVTFEIADESSARSFFESMNQPRINENHSVQQKRANEKAKRVTVSRTRLPPPEINIMPQRKAGTWERKNRLSRLYITNKHFFFEMFARNVYSSPNDSIQSVSDRHNERYSHNGNGHRSTL